MLKTMWTTIWQKISSRKFLAAASVIATGIVMATTGDTQDAATAIVEKSAGAITALLAAVAYIIGEAKVDAARVAAKDK